jgi:precorrin-6B methylase 2
MNWVLAAVLAVSAIPVVSCDSGARVEAAAQNSDRIAEADAPKPLQIGKLVKKRQIAPVMNVAHADWLTRAARDKEEQPDRVVAALKIPKGATVVDLGAGVGYFTWRLAQQVGPHGRVIAVDIQPGMLDRMKKNLEERGVTNVEMVLGTAEDPHLPIGVVDLVLIVDVYHELQHPEKTMEHVRRSLKPNGRVVLIEYRRENPDIPISPLHKMSVEEVRGELEPMGFRLIDLLEFVPTQHIFVFQDALAARR